MKYNKEGDFTHFSELTSDALSFFIRMDVPMLVYAVDNNKKVYSCMAFHDNINKKTKSRVDTKNCKYKVEIKSPSFAGEKSLTALEIMKTISKFTNNGKYDIGITIRNKWVDKYSILFPLIGKVKSSVLEQYYSIKVTDEYILLTGRNIKSYPQEVYYFYDDYSLLKFDENGFSTLIDKSKSKFTPAIIFNSVKFK